MVGKLNPDSKATAMDCYLFKLTGSAWHICHDLCLLPPHLGLVLAILANCSPVHRVIIMQPDAKDAVHSNVALT